MRQPLVVMFLFALACAAGCAGGGGGGSVVPGGPSVAHGTTTASLTITIPAKPTALTKSPAYVSPNTASIGIVVTPQGGTAFPPVYANVPGSSCAVADGGGYACNISVTATYGTDTLVVTDYSGANGGGSVLASGTLISTFSPTAEPSPALNVTLTGQVKQIFMQIGDGTTNGIIAIGSATTLTVIGKDASGATIIGTYDNPITVTLPSNSGIALASTNFIASDNTTTAITWLGAPTYYNAPTTSETITASAGATTGSVMLHPMSTLLSFPVGDGAAADSTAVGLVHDGTSFDIATTDQLSDGELIRFDPTTGSQDVEPSLGFAPNGIYHDAPFGGIWLGGFSSGIGGTLNCYTAPTSTVVQYPVPVPTAGYSDPGAMSMDVNHRLWFLNQGFIGSLDVNGPCAVGTPTPEYTQLPDSSDQDRIVSDLDVDNTFVTDTWDNAINRYTSSGFADTSQLTTEPFAIGHDGAGNIVAVSEDTEYFNGVLEMIPRGTNSVTTSIALWKDLQGTAIDAAATGANAPIAISDVERGGLAIYNPATPALSTFVPIVGFMDQAGHSNPRSASHRHARLHSKVHLTSTIPMSTPYGDCEGVAYDGAGQPWALCEGSNAQQLSRMIITDTWNAYSNLDSTPVGSTGVVGIVGGTASQTFTVSCTTTLACTPEQNFPRIIEIESSAVGAATVTITDSSGRIVTINATIPPQSSGPP